MTRILNSVPLLYVAMLSPGYLVFWGLLNDDWYYAFLMYQSGVYAVRLLIITVAVTPVLMLINRLGRGKTIGRWLLQRRKHFGLACFAYAAAHLTHYIMHEDRWRDILIDLPELRFLTGWIALAIFAALAVTSNKYAVRQMGRNWKSLHMWIFPASALTFWHWYLFDEYTARVLFWVGIFVLVKLIHVALSQWRAASARAATVR